jgi:hypothetical protein
MKVMRPISILLLLFLVSCNRQNQNRKEDVMYIIINNYTDDTIYLNSYFGLGSVDYMEQEKIYYCSTPIYFVDISHDEYSFINAINNFDKNEIRIINRFIIDSAKYRYELNNDRTVSKIYEGECDTMSFRLFYTKVPLRGYGYKNYVNDMKMYGYYAVGYLESDRVIFNISTHTKIEEGILKKGMKE